MPYVRIKGFKIYRDRHKAWRCYHRATGTAIDLRKNPLGSAGFFAECQRMARLYDTAATSRPGTLGMLISDYRAHGSFQNLAARTRADYQRCFDYLKDIEATALLKFTPPLIVRIRDAAGRDLGQKWGTYVKTTLSLIFSWGLERGYVDVNPALRIKGIKKSKDAPDANRPWSDSERHAVLSEASEDPVNLLLPVSFMMFCGLDPGDVVGLPKKAVKDGFIDSRRAKTRQPVWLPLPQPVKDVLARARPHNALTVCASSEGTPWTYSGLDGAWQRLRAKLLKKKLIEPGLTLKGLRHTVATILAEMGYDERTIADMLGQSTIEMARHYSRRADKRKKLTAVITNFDAEMVKRRNAGGQTT